MVMRTIATIGRIAFTRERVAQTPTAFNLSGLRSARGGAAGDAAEHGARHEAGAAGVVVVEEPAHQLTGGVESADRPGFAVQHAALGGDVQAAERERDARGHRVADVGRLVERLRPVRLGRLDAARPLAVLDGRVERAGLHGGVELTHGAHEALDVDLQLAREALERRVFGLRDLADAVLLSEQVHDLLIEDLERGAARLLDDLAAVLHVRVVAHVGALVDETLTLDVDDDADGIRMLLEVVADFAVAVPGGVVVPLHGVTAAPVAPRLRADVERHADAVARVVRGAAHAREGPVGPEIARAHLHVGLEAAGGEHHGLGGGALAAPVGGADLDSRDGAARVGEQAVRLGLEADVDALLLRRLVVHLDEAGPAADRLQHEVAEERELAAHLEGLAPEHRDPADPLRLHPAHRGLRLAHEREREVGVGEVLGHAHQVVVVVVLGVERHVHRRLLLVGEVADQLAYLVETLEREAEAAGREEAVAATPRLRRLLQHEDARALLARRERRAHGGVAAAHDDDVGCGRGHDRMISLICTWGAMVVKFGTSAKSSLPWAFEAFWKSSSDRK